MYIYIHIDASKKKKKLFSILNTDLYSYGTECAIL